MKNILLIILVVFFACKPKQEIVEVDATNKSSSGLIDISIEQNENIMFTIKNISDGDIYIYELGKLKIDKNIDESWERLKILPCPCDAPCHAGNEKELLSSGETFILVWNKEESWCGSDKDGNVRETIKQKVDKGKYRIRLDFADNMNNKKFFNKEFTLD